MGYKKGDIVLIAFPFTNLQKSKKRPVLIIKDENSLNDVVCFQITSKASQDFLYKLDTQSINSGELKLLSYVKYDKCFTLDTKIIDKKLASVDEPFMQKLKLLFCDLVF